jgi:hypothetical protein
MASVSVAPRFVLAKYAPDLARMEPRNIGVFLWSRGSIQSKFLDNSAASSFINEITVYERWIKYWTKTIAGSAISPRRGKPVLVTDPLSMEALIGTQKGNYILSDGGELVSSIRAKNMSAALDSLFAELVAPTDQKSLSSNVPTLAQSCRALLESSGLYELEDFKSKFPVDLTVYGEPEKIHFSYGIGADQPRALLQRVQLNSEESVTSSLLKLHTIVFNASVIKQDALRILYRKQDINTEAADKAYTRLSRLCESVDVESPASSDSLKRLVA